MLRLTLSLWLLLFAAVAHAQGTPPSAQVTARTATLLAMLTDAKADEADFTPAFLAQVPTSRIEAIARQLREGNGPVSGILDIVAETDDQAVVRIDYAKAIVSARIALEPSGTHRFIGLLVTGVERKNDSFAAIVHEMRALDGTAALLVARLDGDAIETRAELNGDRDMAVGSVFKLFVLAALADDIERGTRRWEDVVALGARSLPSGVMQDWPAESPVTLATLATQMISISDNTATDTLMNTLGRMRIDEKRAAYDHVPAALPMLTTREAFTLKMPGSEALRERWETGDLTARRTVLADIDRIAPPIDPAALAGGPMFIDTVEWPVRLKAVAKLLGDFRIDDTAHAKARAILAINPSAPADDRARLAYIGYKGGSESDVLALNWLAQTRNGEWFVVAGAWNNPLAPLDTERFESLMRRALSLIGR